MDPDCNKEWTRKYISEVFPRSFLNGEYKTHLEKILYDKERALLPATQPLVETQVRNQRYNNEISQLRFVIREAKERIKHLSGLIRYGDDDGVSTEQEKKKAFVRQCPAEGCRGFLSSQWKCGLCDMWTCPDCHEVKGYSRECEHTCDPNSVETAKLLSKDSKPCPKCHSLIFKIDGCDQMFCTMCHTAFSWRTGKLETHIHNPHYFEWMRQTGGGQMARAPGDVECGMEITHYTVNEIFIAAKKHLDLYNPTIADLTQRYYNKSVYSITDFARIMVHNRHEELPKYQRDPMERNQDLRIRYLKGEIDEENFKKLIQRADKKNRHHAEIANVIQFTITAATDIIYRIIDSMNNSNDGEHKLHEIMREIDALNKYSNELLRDISLTYGTVGVQFNSDFHLIRACP